MQKLSSKAKNFDSKKIYCFWGENVPVTNWSPQIYTFFPDGFHGLTFFFSLLRALIRFCRNSGLLFGNLKKNQGFFSFWLWLWQPYATQFKRYHAYIELNEWVNIDSFEKTCLFYDFDNFLVLFALYSLLIHYRLKFVFTAFDKTAALLRQHITAGRFPNWWIERHFSNYP